MPSPSETKRTVNDMRAHRNISVKTADYTVTAADINNGTIFTNRGDAGAIVFTLPAVAATFKGKAVEFFQIADQDMTIAGTAGELVTHNDAAANSIAFSTDGEQIGNGVRAVCDGTSWLMFIMAEETVSVTVAT